MRKLQLPRGTTQAANAFTGLLGQPTVDVDRMEIRLHDGVTPGGIRIPNLDFLLTIFRSSGEDPLSEGLPEEGLGIIVRTGEGTYTVRSIGAGAGLDVTHPTGEGGDPSLSFEAIAAQRLLGNNHATDAGVPVALTSAQVIAILQTGLNVLYEPKGKYSSPVIKTASHTLELTDTLGGAIRMNVATSNNLTVPPNADVAFPIDSKVDVWQYGAGVTTFVEGSGVTIRSFEDKMSLVGQYAAATLWKVDTNEWMLAGNLE